MCDFQKLAFSEHGYVVRCAECGYLQLGFGTTMLTITGADFAALYDAVSYRVKSYGSYENACLSDETKGVFIPTASPNCCFVLTKNELQFFYDILDKADDEMKALSLLQLFNDK